MINKSFFDDRVAISFKGSLLMILAELLRIDPFLYRRNNYESIPTVENNY